MAESYTVLARRYRSQNFDQLVGQEVIGQTLKNAIMANRVAHAFLFTGTRGVGKTSVARILAKAINCPNTEKGEPCGVCETCKAIARGEDMDVLEIDGASNNGVDQVRELRQNAGIRPARSPYKIYIIDEVHMLSTPAFNALLKTLEEPPSHVKFIFATTDVHKVPTTILSRVQRFDFKNISTIKIAEHLAEVCRQEGIEADAEAVNRIARLGNGSMRDALSLLDRVLSLGEKHLTEKLLEELLGKPPTAAIAELVEAIAGGDAGAAISRADELLKTGMGAEQVLGELIEFFRNLMLVSVCGEKTELLEVAAELRPRFVQAAKSFDAATLVHLIALSEQTLRSLKSTTMGRALFDALIIRLSMSEQFSAIRDLLQGEGNAAASGAAQKKNDLSPIANAAIRETANAAGDPAAAREAVRAAMAPPIPVRISGRPQAHAPASLPHAVPIIHAAPAAPIAAVNSERDMPPAGPLDLSDLPAVWEAARRHLVESKNGSINSNLGPTSRLQSMDAESGRAVLAVPAHMKAYAGEKIRLKIEESLKTVAGRPVRLEIISSDALSPTLRSSSDGRPGPGGRPNSAGGPAYASPAMQSAQRVPPELDEAVRNQPIVRTLIEKLGGDVKMIEILESESDAS